MVYVVTWLLQGIYWVTSGVVQWSSLAGEVKTLGFLVRLPKQFTTLYHSIGKGWKQEGTLYSSPLCTTGSPVTKWVDDFQDPFQT